MITSRRFDFVREDWIKWGKGTLVALLPILAGAVGLILREIDQSTFMGGLEAVILVQVLFWIKTWVSVHSYQVTSVDTTGTVTTETPIVTEPSVVTDPIVVDPTLTQ